MQWCAKYHVVLDLVITALDCIVFYLTVLYRDSRVIVCYSDNSTLKCLLLTEYDQFCYHYHHNQYVSSQRVSFACIYIGSTTRNIKQKVFCSLPWRHNEHDGVSNHQPHDCLLNRLSRRRSKKTCENMWKPVNSPHKGPVTQKMFPFDDVIMLKVDCYSMIDICGIGLGYHWFGDWPVAYMIQFNYFNT